MPNNTKLPQGDLKLLESEMARIALRPAWVGAIDFETRLPGSMAGAN